MIIKLEGTKVIIQHYSPELLTDKDKEGFIETENAPIAEIIEGKTAILHYSDENGFWYEYIDVVVEEQPIPTPTQTNADIEQLRQSAYMTESNPILMAYNQYQLLGETEKAEAKKAEWLVKVEEIRTRYPYI